MLSLFKKKEKPVYQAYIQSMDKTVTVKHRQTLLEAALEAGLDYPYSCGAGSCTTCKTKLIQGQYKDLSDMSLVLTEDDLKKGYILACQALPKSDLIVTLEAYESKEYSREMTGYHRLTHDIVEVKIRLSEKMRYSAGQYADLAVAGVKGSRSYSFAAAPGAGGGSRQQQASAGRTAGRDRAGARRGRGRHRRWPAGPDTAAGGDGGQPAGIEAAGRR